NCNRQFQFRSSISSGSVSSRVLLSGEWTTSCVRWAVTSIYENYIRVKTTLFCWLNGKERTPAHGEQETAEGALDFAPPASKGGWSPTDRHGQCAREAA